MKVSVVIPAYNEERYIGECLESLMRQTVKPDEIIVVDNNSTDNTVNIAKKYPVTIIKEKEVGITATRNRGFDRAKYEIIIRTDADTILPPNWIKKIKKYFLDSKIIALSGPAYFYELPNVTNAYSISKSAFDSYRRVLRRILRSDFLHGPNFAIRRSVWEKVKPSTCKSDKEVHEDIDLTIHLLEFGKIKFYQTLEVKTSFRRWKKLESYFKYTYKGLLSIERHKEFSMRQRSRQFMKRFVSKTLVNRLISDYKNQKDIFQKLR